jgi:hypothetical protein
MENLIVISADHHGDCLLGLSFDENSMLLSVRHLLENIIIRDTIVANLEPIITELFPYSGGYDQINLVVIDNEVLASYIGKNLMVRGRARRPIKGDLPASAKETTYRLRCAINEGNLSGDGWIDQIEVALSAESNPDRIEGHLVQCLGYACDEYLDSIHRPASLMRGMVRR